MHVEVGYRPWRSQRFCPVDSYLILYRHHQNAADLEEHLHVIFMVLLHPGAAVNAVVLVTVRGDLQAVPHLEDGFAELKPEGEAQALDGTVVPRAATRVDSLIKAVAVLYETVQFLPGVFHHVLMELHSVVHAKRPLKKRHKRQL